MMRRTLAESLRPARFLTRAVLEAALPADCPVCAGPLGTHRAGVCAGCWRELAVGPSAHPGAGGGAIGGRFLASLTCIGAYDGRLRRIIRCLKFEDLPGLAVPLGDLLERRLGDVRSQIDVVAPVPLHWSRRWRRGYNQAELIAARVAARLDKPLAAAALRRIRATASQTGRSRRDRVLNLRRAFRPGRTALQGHSVLLVDDVVTTGATMRECARVLKAAGARRVHAAVLARTLSRNVT